MKKILVASCVLSLVLASSVLAEGNYNSSYEVRKSNLEARKQKIEQKEQMLDQRYQQMQDYRQKVQTMKQEHQQERQELINQRPKFQGQGGNMSGGMQPPPPPNASGQWKSQFNGTNRENFQQYHQNNGNHYGPQNNNGQGNKYGNQNFSNQFQGRTPDFKTTGQSMQHNGPRK